MTHPTGFARAAPGLALPQVALCLAVAAASALGSAPAARAAPAAPWTAMTGLPGATFDSMVFDATHPGVALLGSKGGIIFRSTDGGASWTPVKVGGNTESFRAIAFNPNGGNVVYAFSENGSYDGTTPVNCVYVSQDNGKSWANVKTAPSGLVGSTPTSAFFGRGIVVANAATVLISDHVTGTYLTTDGGKSWRNTLPFPARPYNLVRDPAKASVVWAAGYTRSAGVNTPRVWRSADYGKTWTTLTPSGFAAGDTLYGITIQPGTGIIFAGVNGSNGTGGIAYSTDGGKSFTKSTGLPALYSPGNAAGWMAFAANNPAVIIASCNGCVSPALVVSTDSGKSFTAGLNLPGGSGGFTLVTRPALGSFPLALFAGAGDVYASLNALTYSPSNTGLTRAAIIAMSDDGQSTPGIFAGSTSGLFHSTDSGKTWTKLTTPGNVQLAYQGAIATQLTGTTHPLYAVNALGNLFISATGGASWQAAALPGTPGEVYNPVVEPNAAAHVFVTSGSGSTLFVSADQGKTWVARTAGSGKAKFTAPLAVAAKPAGLVFAAMSDGLWRSRDYGKTWTMLPASAPGGALANTVYGVVAQPVSPYAVFAITENSQQLPELFASKDQGKSWSDLGKLPIPDGLPPSIAGVPLAAQVFGPTDQFASPSLFCALNAGTGFTDVCGGLKALADGTEFLSYPLQRQLVVANFTGPAYSAPWSSLPKAPSALAPLHARPQAARRPPVPRPAVWPIAETPARPGQQQP